MSARRLAASLPAAVLFLAVAAAVRVDALPAGGVPGAGPGVQIMVVGTGGTILSPARTVTAGETTVRVAKKTCAVAAGTPLAALVALRRGGGPGFALRDYGNCGPSPRNSGQLFVYSLAGEMNRGQDGWEYKVDGASGTTGAGDPGGPRGDGRRLRAGERLLWFWCQAAGGGCERTLEVAPAVSTVARGGSFTVTVTGYDNEGRGTPVAGAIVTLGADFASTGSGGRATLIAPLAPGRYRVSVVRVGLVPSFPETIVVR